MKTTSASRLAYSYIRLSSAEQLKGLGLTRQTKLAEDYARAHGLKLSAQTFSDLGVSAYSGKNVTRGALADFISLVEKGKIPKGSVLLIEQLDRWSRQQPLEALAQLQRLLKLGIEVVTLADGKSYTKDSLGENVGDLFYSLAVLHRAHEESLTKSRRGVSNWKQKRANAATKVLTKMSPGWLSLAEDGKTWHVDMRKAKVVERVFQLSAEGHGREAIAKMMNREKVSLPTRRGTQWHGSTVDKLIKSPSVIGMFQPGRREAKENGSWRRVADGEAVENYYPAIVSKRLWLKTRQAARPKLPPGPKAGSTVNLFSGLVKCGSCGSTLHYINKGENGNGGGYLICEKSRRGLCKSSRGWRYDRFEPLMLTLLHRVIRWDTLVPKAKSQHKATLAKLEERCASIDVELASVNAKLAKVVEAIEDIGVSPTLKARLASLEAQRESLERQRQPAKERLEAERERVKDVREATAESRAAFKDWQSGKLSKNATARHRLAVVLRDMLSRIVLTIHDKPGYGPAVEPRKLQVVFRSPEEGPEDFTVDAALTTVVDPHDGSTVVAFGPEGALTVKGPGGGQG